MKTATGKVIRLCYIKGGMKCKDNDMKQIEAAADFASKRVGALEKDSVKGAGAQKWFYVNDDMKMSEVFGKFRNFDSRLHGAPIDIACDYGNKTPSCKQGFSAWADGSTMPPRIVLCCKGLLKQKAGELPSTFIHELTHALLNTTDSDGKARSKNLYIIMVQTRVGGPQGPLVSLPSYITDETGTNRLPTSFTLGDGQAGQGDPGPVPGRNQDTYLQHAATWEMFLLGR